MKKTLLLTTAAVLFFFGSGCARGKSDSFRTEGNENHCAVRFCQGRLFMGKSKIKR